MGKVYYIHLTIYFHKEDDNRWTAECLELGCASFDNSLDEAKESIEEAIELKLTGLSEVGELNRFLKENNVIVFKEFPQEIKQRKIKVQPKLDPNIFEQHQFRPLQQYAEAAG